jgi:hypothetical protein
VGGHLSGERLKGVGEIAAMPLHVVPDKVIADHPGRLAVVAVAPYLADGLNYHLRDACWAT